MDFGLIALIVTCVPLQVAQQTAADYAIGKIARNQNKFYNLALLVSWDELNSILLGVLVFLFNVRMLRLVKFSNRLAIFLKVLEKMRRTGLSFSFFFVMIFLAFVQGFYLLFFSRVRAYSKFLTSVNTLMNMLLGTCV